MDLENLPINWFDLAVVVVLLLGVWRGRKHGMSEEMLPVIQWVAILFACGALYELGGQFIAQSTVFSLLSSYVGVYIAIMIIIRVLFALFKHGLGGKLIGSDAFGRAEYYLGMGAGMVRYACVLMLTLGLLNARYFSPAEIRAMANFQQDVYGSQFFPTLHTLQEQVFERSFIGPLIREHLGYFLIQPTPPQVKQFKREEAVLP